MFVSEHRFPPSAEGGSYLNKAFTEKRTVGTELGYALVSAGQAAQYDERAKRLLGNKQILGHILVNTIDDFKGMDPKKAVSYIEGEPLIGTVPVEPGLTNTAVEKEKQRIVGFNSEQAEINEGLARFDIVFYVRSPSGVSQIIINVEAQKDEPSGYGILNRAIFYVSRLISSQKERDFTGMDYDDIKRVYSIWICMNREENGMNHIHLTDDRLLGNCQWKGRLDIPNIVLISLSNELPPQKKGQELHRLLGVLFSKVLSADEKIDIIETEYDVSVNSGIREDVSIMCNLSQGILEDGIAIGMERGIEQGIERGIEQGIVQGEAGIIFNMYKKGYTLEQISEMTDKSIEEIQGILRNK